MAASTPKQSGCPFEPPCSAMLDGFAAVMSDHARWPNHLCMDTARISVERWASLSVVKTGYPVGAWQTLWPLPIGRRALKAEAERWYPVDKARPKVLPPKVADLLAPGWSLVYAFPFLPFDGDERAFFAASIEQDGARIDLFGLSTAQHSLPGFPAELLASNDSPPTPEFLMAGPLMYLVRGRYLPGKEEEKHLKSARRWWKKHVEGRPLVSSPDAGRKKGSGRLSRDELLQEIERAASKLYRGYPRLPVRLVARQIGMSRQSLYDNLGHHELTWSEVKANLLRTLKK